MPLNLLRLVALSLSHLEDLPEMASICRHRATDPRTEKSFRELVHSLREHKSVWFQWAVPAPCPGQVEGLAAPLGSEAPRIAAGISQPVFGYHGSRRLPGLITHFGQLHDLVLVFANFQDDL